MLRDGKDESTPDSKFKVRRYILESQVEGQDVRGFAPPTDELPDTHEHYIKHFTGERNGKPLMFVEIGVRPKVIQPTIVSDGLDELGMADLQTLAPKEGVDISGIKPQSKVKIVKAIREARAAEPSLAGE